MARHRTNTLTIAALVLTSAAMSACGPEKTVRRPADRSSSSSGDGVLDLNPIGGGRTVRVTAGVLPLGTIPYDNFALPLVSPTGAHIATETGVEPYPSTVYAEPGADTSPATRVDIYTVRYEQRRDDETDETPRLQRTAEVVEPALLGRACDASGFLVEQQLDDGSRRIGRASWATGDIEWLVDDGHVNAFASFGPAGQLAWCRRSPEDAELFDLVIRGTDGREWTAGEGAESWLMPTWSGRRDGLFVLVVDDGRLEMVYGVATTPVTFRQSQRRIVLSSNGSVRQAYKVSIGQPQVHGLDVETVDERIMFVHPVTHRMAVWRPTAANPTIIYELHGGSFAAVNDDGRYVITATGRNLYRQNATAPKDVAPLLRGTFVPRRTARDDYGFLLFIPGEAEFGVTAMRLIGVQ